MGVCSEAVRISRRSTSPGRASGFRIASVTVSAELPPRGAAAGAGAAADAACKTTAGGLPGVDLLGAVGTGETVGEINLLDPSAASASVTAVEFSQVWCIDSKSLESYINEYPRAAAWLLIGIGKTIARRLRTVNEKIASCSLPI